MAAIEINDGWWLCITWSGGGYSAPLWFFGLVAAALVSVMALVVVALAAMSSKRREGNQ